VEATSSSLTRAIKNTELWTTCAGSRGVVVVVILMGVFRWEEGQSGQGKSRCEVSCLTGLGDRGFHGKARGRRLFFNRRHARCGRISVFER